MRFRRKERGTRVKDRAMAQVLASFLARPKTENRSRSLAFLCSITKLKRLLRGLYVELQR